MHLHDHASQELMAAIFAAAEERLAMDPPPLDGPRTARELEAATGQTITAAGLGAERVLHLFTEVLAPACLSMDHPRYLSFVPNASTEAAVLFDLMVSASNIYGGSWLEGAGAVHAENQALRWLSDLAGLPAGAGGAFVSGGSLANLSALAVARHRWRAGGGGADGAPPLVAVSRDAHSSVGSALELLDVAPLLLPVDDVGRLRPQEWDERTRAGIDRVAPRVMAVVGTGGLTNSGGIDDLDGIADLARDLDAWFHVDAAYGGGALCTPRRRGLFAGIERADSVTVDPHKWLFAPYDCAAVLYAEPSVARAAFTQRAEYLDPVNDAGDWNPSDYGPHLSRRARGLPFWFSVAMHGTDAYRAAVEETIDRTEEAARFISEAPHLELLMEPELSVLLFRRTGWGDAEYQAWSTALLRDQVGFVVPTTWGGETVGRICILNPRTTLDDVIAVLPSA
jgi:L-2,4-diaminobutyrate decarboxylase